VIVEAPLEADDILHRRGALVHCTKLIETQTFQPRLHALHPTGSQRFDLALLQIALRFNKHVQITMIFCQFAEQIVDVPHVDDVVDQPKPNGIVALGKLSNLC